MSCVWNLLWLHLVEVVVVVMGAVGGSSSGRPVQAEQRVGTQLEVSQVEERGRGLSSARAGAEAGTGPGTGPGTGSGTGSGNRKHRDLLGKFPMLRTDCSHLPARILLPHLNFLVLPGVLVVLVLGALVWSPSRSCSDDSS